jgi:hypothetical protein
MATTKTTGSPKKQSSPTKKKASSPIKRQLTTMTISTKKKMAKAHQGREFIANGALENGAFCTVFSENFHKF